MENSNQKQESFLINDKNYIQLESKLRLSICLCCNVARQYRDGQSDGEGSWPLHTRRVVRVRRGGEHHQHQHRGDEELYGEALQPITGEHWLTWPDAVLSLVTWPADSAEFSPVQPSPAAPGDTVIRTPCIHCLYLRHPVKQCTVG